MKSFRWIKIGAMVLMSAGIALALTVPTFATSRGALANSEVKSSIILIKSGDVKPEVIFKQHGTITVAPVSDGQWQATWTWQGLHNDMLPIILVGSEGTQVNGGTSNISSESAPTYSGDSVSIDFTPPSSYPAQPEVCSLFRLSMRGSLMFRQWVSFPKCRGQLACPSSCWHP